jgi:hypothetical protein
MLTRSPLTALGALSTAKMLLIALPILAALQPSPCFRGGVDPMEPDYDW